MDLSFHKASQAAQGPTRCPGLLDKEIIIVYNHLY
jgi:hypothetical protein